MNSNSGFGTCQKCGAALSSHVLGELCPTCLLQSGLDRDVPLAEDIVASGFETAPAGGPLGRFGDYELLGEIARGGMGVVYLARQLRLNRLVAVKLLLFGRFSTADFVRRFRTEASAAASLQHPNIVAIHETGEHEGQPYFSMDYVEGKSLAELVRGHPLPPLQAARYLRIIAEAIQYAHQHGILHRDLKPSNVLIDPFDQPRITDFGLAKQLEGDSDLTVTGQALGSPNFMPPEQALGRHAEAGPRSDVYSLGAMLYHGLTGRPPFQGATVQEVLLQVQDVEPVPPRRLNPSVPADLETICLKCLEKDPARRYGTAQALADELRRYAAGGPILARPIGPFTRAARWCRRYPVVASLAAVIILLLGTVAIGSSLAAARLERAERAATQKLWESYLAQARAERFRPKAGRRAAALETIAKAARLRPALELRNEAIASLAVPDLEEAKAWIAADDFRTDAVRFDQALANRAEITSPGDVQVRRVDNDEITAVLSTRSLTPTWIFGFSPDARYLGLQTRRGGNSVWDVSRAQMVVSNIPALSPVEFAPLEPVVAYARADGAIILRHLVSGGVRELTNSIGAKVSMTFHPDGHRLACFDEDRRVVEIFDLTAGKVWMTLPVREECTVLTWSRDGSLFAAGTASGKVQVWNGATGERINTFEAHDGRVVSITFAHSSDLLATASWDATTRFWSALTGKQWLEYPGSGYFQTFSPDDRRLGPVIGLNRFAILEVSQTAAYRQYPRGVTGEKGRTLAVSPDGRWLISTVRDAAHLWDARIGRHLGILPFADARSAVIPPDGKSLLVTGLGGVRRWPVDLVENELRLGPPQTLRPGGRNLFAASISADGRLLAFGDSTLPGARVIDLKDGTTKFKLGPHTRTESVAISPDGRWVATGPWNVKGVKVWEAAKSNVVCDIPTGPGSLVLFSPDGQWLAVSSDDLQLWETRPWRRGPAVPVNKPNHPAGAMAFSPDAKLLAVVEAGVRVKLLDCEKMTTLAALEHPNGFVILSLCFHPDGRALLALDAKNDVHVWSLGPLRSELAKLGLDWKGLAPGQLEATDKKPAQPLKLLFAYPAGRGPKKAIPSRHTRCTDAQIDLSGHYTSALDESWFVYFEDDSLASLPHGLHALDGVQFDLRGLIQLQGTREGDAQFPDRASNIRVDRFCQRLHFLHATHRHPSPGREIGHYLVRFRNGSEIRLPLVYGYNTMDWWVHAEDRQDLQAMQVAWTGTNAAATASKTQVRLFKWTWKNPLPDLEIASIDFVSALNGCAPFLVAVTAE
jgi:WD40 repeat protein